MIEVNTTFKFEDKENNPKNLILRLFMTIVKISEEIKEKRNGKLYCVMCEEDLSRFRKNF